MAVDILLKIEGVKGESVEAGHEDEIDVEAWSWGMSQSGTTHRGRGSGSGQANVQDIIITKLIDTSTPTIMEALLKGQHFPQAEMWVRKAGADGAKVDYLYIKMENLMITSYDTGAGGSEDSIMETISLNFAKVEFEYTPQKEDGTAGASVRTGYNIAEGQVA